MATALSIDHGDPHTPLLDETIGMNLRRISSTFPAHDAVIVRSQNIRATYDDLWRDVEVTARVLLASGIQTADRVGVWSANRYEWVVVQYATARIGAILVNINPAYMRSELGYALCQSGIRLLFHGGRFKSTEFAPLLDAVLPQCPDLERCIDFDQEWQAFLGERRADLETLAKREATLSADDAINIQYTSGTTGLPKAATLTHHNILNNAYHCALALRYTSADRVCVPVPFYHCFGMVLGTLAVLSVGACLVVPSEIFQPLAVLQAIEAERCTSVYGVPTMYRAILEHPEFDRIDVQSLRTGIMAGSPCPVELMKEVVDSLHMPEIAIGYGMTETSPLSTFTQPDDSLQRRVSTVGRVMPRIEISLRDSDNQPVPRGTPGEFCARGYHVMLQYWNDLTATKQVIDAEGWMHSGDQAVMDKDGYVHITGRLKDLIIRGGENISPREVEGILETHPAISEAQVIGVPSHRYGEEVMAWIKFRPGRCATEAELCAFSSERMAAFKRPRFWQFVESFPMTVTGKIRKFQLRQTAIELLQLQSAAAEKMA